LEILHLEVGIDYAFALIKGDRGLEYSNVLQSDEFNMCSCSCPDQQYRKRICKHMDFFLDYLECVYPEYWKDHADFLREEDRCQRIRNEERNQDFLSALSAQVH